MLANKIGKVITVILVASTFFFFVPRIPNLVLADITCANSDYNCIYVDTINGNRIVCTMSVCGSGSFGGRSYQLEGLYAFDGVNPNIAATSTTATTNTVVVGSSTSSTSTVVGSSTSSSTSSTTTVVSGINPCLDPRNPNYACGWAVLGTNNIVTGVIVCTFAVCGSGSFGGMRLVLQGQQTSDGNVAGWHGPDVKYDESSQLFTLPGEGTLKSGGKLEEAVFPTTTVITIEPTTTAVSNEEVRASVGGVEVKSETTVTEGAVAVSVGEITAEIASAETTGDASNTRAEQGLVLSSGESADISIDGLQPNSEVEVVIYSTPRNLGSLKVNESGELIASIVIPSDMESGPHTLVLSGFNKFGEQVELKFGLVVYSPDAYIPVWVWSLVGLLVISLAVSLGTRRSKKALIAI